MGKKGEKDGKLNIAMLGHKRIPSREGGVEIVVEELATRMVSNGHKVTAYNRSGHHVSGKEFDTSKKKVKEYKGVRIKKVLTIEMKGLAALSSSFFAALKATFGRYDVIHFHAEGPSVMTIIAKLSRKKIIVTIHGLDWQRAKWGKGAVKYLKMGENLAKMSGSILKKYMTGIPYLFLTVLMSRISCLWNVLRKDGSLKDDSTFFTLEELCRKKASII